MDDDEQDALKKNVPSDAMPSANLRSPDVPVGALEVTATGTLEWLRQDQMYVARQNAVAKHDDMTIKGNVLVAHYIVPPGKKDGMQLSVITADGDPVTLITPSAVAFGQHGAYDMDKHQAILLGNNLKLVTTDEVVTAKDSLEYFQDLDIGVARGNAVMLRDDDKLTADVIAVKFVKNDGKSSTDASASGQQAQNDGSSDGSKKTKSESLERMDAKGHVVLVTPTDVVTGDEAVYNPNTDQTTVLGDVHMTRDQNQLDGNRAEVDMGTGISRVYAAPNAKVRGLFVPKKKDPEAADASQNGGDSR